MNFTKQTKSYILFVLIIITYSLITLPRLINHIPYFDEAHAWTIAQYMNINNWNRILNAEGHTIIWYLCLMPFAKFHIAYPYTLLAINWIFMLSAIIILWKKSPFDNVMKIIFTLSPMILFEYSIISRCYAIGILGLFILASQFNKQIERQIVYATILALTLNTNVVCAIGAGAFSLIFVHKLLRKWVSSKKNFLSLIILFLGTALLVLPLIGCNSSLYNIQPVSVHNISKYWNFPIFCTYLIVVSYLIFFTKSKCAKFFLCFTFLMLSALFIFVYQGWEYHHFFYMIYLYIALWIHISEEKCNTHFPLFVYCAIFVCLFFFCRTFHYEESSVTALAKAINSEYPNSRILTNAPLQALYPYLNKDIEIYDMCSGKQLTWEISHIDNVRTCWKNTDFEMTSQKWAALTDTDKPIRLLLVDTNDNNIYNYRYYWSHRYIKWHLKAYKNI